MLSSSTGRHVMLELFLTSCKTISNVLLVQSLRFTKHKLFDPCLSREWHLFGDKVRYPLTLIIRLPSSLFVFIYCFTPQFQLKSFVIVITGT
ncbi:hypothetical protein NECAME_01782 [Necator americanus]|uniref:Uncharacterized protein n=1 Tax=Necator americanus TaxID=51031 RepID=W2TMZ5_NECAM|nr:hypothetical protein NECAME_01782 [Necator americanus]ETN83475.1 hypothetical protein NECAME_01782 [Necator americanus]